MTQFKQSFIFLGLSLSQVLLASCSTANLATVCQGPLPEVGRELQLAAAALGMETSSRAVATASVQDPSVLSSIWNANDASTQESVMSSIHQTMDQYNRELQSPKLESHERAIWSEWSIGQLKQIQHQMDIVAEDPRGKKGLQNSLYDELSAMATEFVAFHGQATHGSVLSMKNTIKGLEERSRQVARFCSRFTE